MSYQAQGKLIAILELIVCSCCLMGVVVAAVMFSMKKEELSKDEPKLEKYPNLREFVESSSTEQAMTFLIPGVYLTVELILAGMLYIGASEIKPALLKTWVGLTLLMAAVGVVFAGFGIVSAQDKLAPIAITAFGYLFTAWSILVGFQLSKQTKSEGEH
ncbi:uncharacterized protein LOC118434572 [Folsomia candida]|uniref:Uncharacterized protein n=1 Tax=Folsomia candida TaxID=158441 RepID=A0A226EP42_FOLCA|nr:uncharacterized protein LOC118434572 [Folsomia candida]OXA59279.1 hypothetical protein Fcan01_06245 [Folsomia candida]